MAFKEKRREERFPVELECKISKDDVSMSVLDISLHGISISGMHQLNVDTHVDIILGSKEDPIGIGAVVRNAVTIGDKYRYGLEIMTVPDKWMNLVYSYMIANK